MTTQPTSTPPGAGFEVEVGVRVDNGTPTVELRLTSNTTGRQLLAPLDPEVARSLAVLLVKAADRADQLATWGAQ